ncbi:molybdenum cofactor biosynthesis protein MoaE [Rhodopirellula sp. JC740]|uniref:Molybdopterin synthase catalytic subunit n=1 Tax=Rhodopirellula halodulae TaxID=2894198 RepID=A0ABS8NIV5_9BACT|nr:molybdenum cofactor biosynthesis protein MoaE [Rhodopirellula sp. JC740]MCC9643461.1 molybdenum cofactor biosynthesis protein MoaE [Rhodopirellula sp. JC740]
MKAEPLTVVDSTVNIRLTDDPLEPLLDSENATAWLSHPDAGAMLWFHGVTRRTTILKDQVSVTEELVYTAHREMAVKELQRIASEAIEEYSLHRIVLWHRLGIVPISEASVIVGCSSSHRVAALQAVASVMDHLKRDVPIWKQERFESGDRQWIHPSPTTDDPH